MLSGVVARNESTRYTTHNRHQLGSEEGSNLGPRARSSNARKVTHFELSGLLLIDYRGISVLLVDLENISFSFFTSSFLRDVCIAISTDITLSLAHLTVLYQ